MKHKIVVVIGCDCDPDRSGYGGTAFSEPRLVWRGILQGIPSLLNQRNKIERKYGKKIKISWNVRADEQIKSVYGSTSWCLEEFKSLWETLNKEGNEIAWHPHVIRWNQKICRWYQEIDNLDWIAECYETGFNAFKIWGNFPRSLHTGWCFHNNLTLQKASALGIEIDYSALPGINTINGREIRNKGLLDVCDWRITPRYPYLPSKQDYRRPAKASEPSLSILELPATVCTTKSVKFLKRVHESFKRKTITPLLSSLGMGSVFLNITASPMLFSVCLNEFFSNIKQNKFFVTYFHSDELLGSEYKISVSSKLYSLENMMRNIERLISTAERYNLDITFMTASEVSKYLRGT